LEDAENDTDRLGIYSVKNRKGFGLSCQSCDLRIARN